MFMLQIDAENNEYKLSAFPELEQIDEDVDSYDEVVVMRYGRNHEPQFIEITNPAEKVVVLKVNLVKSLEKMCIFNLQFSACGLADDSTNVSKHTELYYESTESYSTGNCKGNLPEFC